MPEECIDDDGVESGRDLMRSKLLWLAAWIFYLAERRTADPIWLACLIYCCVLAVCVYFFQKENRAGADKPGKS